MFILLKATKQYKGIIIITHQEQWFNWSIIKEKYYIILHLNWDISVLKRSNYIDYYMFPKSEIKCSQDLGYDCTNFIKKTFNPYENIENVNEEIININKKYNLSLDLTRSLNEKQFDFIYNGRCVPFKKTLDICKYFTYLARNNITSVMIIMHMNDNAQEYYESVINYYNSLNQSIKKKFQLIDTSVFKLKNEIFHGLTLEEVALFCKSSNIYIHGSDLEGTSRSMHEAVCSGCVIMAKESMHGGALSYLTEENSVLYNHSTFPIKYKEALLKSKDYKCEKKNIIELSEMYMIPKMLQDLYYKCNYKEKLEFDKFKKLVNTEEPQLNWAAHNNNVPWYLPGKPVSHIKTKEQVKILMNYL